VNVTFIMTDAEKAADDARARAYAASLSPEAYSAALAELKKPTRRAAPVAGPHVDTLTPDQAARELRRLGVNRRR
jgi:hypothetical protein